MEALMTTIPLPTTETRTSMTLATNAPGQFTRRFDQLSRTDVSMAGGKGANLGEMARAQLPVPPGFVVLVAAYERALDAAGVKDQLRLLLDNIDVDDTAALNAAARTAQQIIRDVAIPDDVRREIGDAYTKVSTANADAVVAVRSSATGEDAPSASFAGMFESYLQVQGFEDVLARVRDCWASAYGARVLFYRVKNRMDLQMPVAVVVQRMIPADKSGVIFTANPATHDAATVVIEASWGLGEPVVQGRVTPDRYVVDKATLCVRECIVAVKQDIMIADASGASVEGKRFDPAERVLSDVEVVALTELALRAEKHFGCPQDLEFAIDETGVYLTQTRPITTLVVVGQPAHKQVAELKTLGADAAAIVRGLGASPGVATGPVRVLANPGQSSEMCDGEVLVAHMTSPDWVPLMRHAAAIVTDAGGMTSHAAIVSRELGVPCVVGTRDATRRLHTGMLVTVNGGSGVVTTRVDARVGIAQDGDRRGNAAISASRQSSIITATRIYVNMGDAAQAERVAAMNVDGVGLLRAEFLLLDALGGAHPKQLLAEGKRDDFVARLAASLQGIAKAFAPRIVVYRATDFRSNEFRALRGGAEHEPEEANPMIGYRGCFRYVQEPELFVAELDALALVRRTHANVHLMIPFVRTEWEMRQCMELIRRGPTGGDRNLKVWVMAEVPSVIWRIPEYAALGVTALSIGSNDLTQLVLGVDRDNERLAPLYDERDSAVQAAIREIIARGHANGMTVSICGQAPSVYPEYAEFLVRAGIDSISVVPDAVERTRANVARAEQALVLDVARGRATGGAQ
jgi:pyruvate,water dikinase